MWCRLTTRCSGHVTTKCTRPSIAVAAERDRQLTQTPPSKAVAQIKIYGIREHLEPVRAKLSDAIHSCIVEALQFPIDKRAHRFFAMDSSDFYYPSSASPRYTIIEISLFEGRSVETKKALIRLLFERVGGQCDRLPNEIEVTISETPKHNWGFRGLPGDEVGLSYKVEV